MPNKYPYMTVLKYFLFFYFFSAVYQSLCLFSDISGTVGLRDSFYSTFLCLLPVLIFSQHAKLIALLIGIILWLSSLFSLGYFFIYRQEFSQSVLFIIFESNIVESKEFLETYFNWAIVPSFAIYSLIAYFLWKRLENFELALKGKSILILLSVLISFSPFLKSYFFENFPLSRAISKQMDKMQSASPWNLIFGYVKYKEDLHNMEDLLSKNRLAPPVSNMKMKINTPNTLVLVIGESTNRNRMGLYGYNRDTSPNLTKMKDDLVLFDNIYSARPYTIEILQQALTFADQENPDLYITKPNIINIMKQAGYTTYWVTNQQTQTTRNTMLTTFSKMADNQVYLNNNRRQNSSSYDEVILEPFEKIMNENNVEKKFIVLHLLGTHARYDYRYPDTFAKFNNMPVSSRDLNSDELNTYNAYDNAILYNDYIISSIINIIKKNNTPSSMFYLSDHGEEVFDDPKQKKMGRNEFAPTNAMYTVPFMIYGNEKWNEISDIKKLNEYKHRIYSTSHFLHTYCDFVGINFDEFEAKKSIISKDYEILPILIGDPSKKSSLRNLLKNPL